MSILEARTIVQRVIEDTQDIEEDIPGQRRDYFRQEIIRVAIRAADQIILEASNGTKENTLYLTAKVAEGLFNKLILSATAEQLTQDLEARLPKTSKK